jgi:hypothetical protein
MQYFFELINKLMMSKKHGDQHLNELSFEQSKKQEIVDFIISMLQDPHTVQISKWLQGKENVKVYFEDNNVVYDA